MSCRPSPEASFLSTQLSSRSVADKCLCPVPTVSLRDSSSGPILPNRGSEEQKDSGLDADPGPPEYCRPALPCPVLRRGHDPWLARVLCAAGSAQHPLGVLPLQSPAAGRAMCVRHLLQGCWWRVSVRTLRLSCAGSGLCSQAVGLCPRHRAGGGPCPVASPTRGDLARSG